MKTSTHFVINFLLADRLGWSPRDRVIFALGGILPDVAMIATFGATVFIVAVINGAPMAEAIAEFRGLYEENALLISAHNLLHSPLSLTLLLLTSLIHRGPGGTDSRLFLAGAARHSLVDIYTHVDDGPLVLSDCAPD